MSSLSPHNHSQPVHGSPSTPYSGTSSEPSHAVEASPQDPFILQQLQAIATARHLVNHLHPPAQPLATQFLSHWEECFVALQNTQLHIEAAQQDHQALHEVNTTLSDQLARCQEELERSRRLNGYKDGQVKSLKEDRDKERNEYAKDRQADSEVRKKMEEDIRSLRRQVQIASKPSTPSPSKRRKIASPDGNRYAELEGKYQQVHNANHDLQKEIYQLQLKLGEVENLLYKAEDENLILKKQMFNLDKPFTSVSSASHTAREDDTFGIWGTPKSHPTSSLYSVPPTSPPHTSLPSGSNIDNSGKPHQDVRRASGFTLHSDREVAGQDDFGEEEEEDSGMRTVTHLATPSSTPTAIHPLDDGTTYQNRVVALEKANMKFKVLVDTLRAENSKVQDEKNRLQNELWDLMMRSAEDL